MQYKVWVLAFGESTWATNGLDFDSVEEANTYARGLYGRWTAAKELAVLPLAEHPHYLDSQTIEDLRVGEVIGRG